MNKDNNIAMNIKRKSGGPGFLFTFLVCVMIYSCHSSVTDQPDEPSAEVRTPVTVTSVTHMSLEDYIEMNATSAFLQQNYIKSNLNGYIEKSNIRLGDYVHQGKVLFVLKTREAKAIGNAVNQLNPDFHFSGVNVLRCGASGYVTQVNHQDGDYVQDGEQLAVISDSRSFLFIMNVPYEDKPYVSPGKHVKVILPDSEVLQGTVSASMPVMDPVSQTQSYSIRVNSGHRIPPGLIARVKVLKVSVTDAQTLPKRSVLSDETQTEFWVMELINDSTAVKVPVKKGLEKGDTVQILSPDFSAGSKILAGGNYGLPDTASVIVNKPQQ